MRMHPTLRRLEHVRRPNADTEFETMCADVCSELYRSPSAVCNGTSGYLQNGRDILLYDWSMTEADAAIRIWVQCKHTAVNKINHERVLKDIRDAAALAGSDQYYQDAKLFIVVTSGSNDAALRAKIDEMAADPGEAIPFRVDLRCWDWVCAQVCNHTSLWQRYNSVQDMNLEAGQRIQAELLSGELENAIRDRRFSDARKAVHRWQQPELSAQYETSGLLPHDAWRACYQLREQLLTLYRLAGDARAAADLLQYETDLPEQSGADSLLAYLHACRVADEIKRNPSGYQTVIRYGAFSSRITFLFERISNAKGTPDALGCLALLAILESNNPELHVWAMNAMAELVARTRGTPSALIAQVTQAVVRFYYVVRHGWERDACFYALGDLIDDCIEVGVNDDRLGRPFDHHPDSFVTLVGLDPLNGYRGLPRNVATTLVTFLCARYGADPTALPKLSRETTLYRLVDFPNVEVGRGESTIELESYARVVDSIKLFRLALDEDFHAVRRRYTLLTTELTYERILGARAMARAIDGREGRQGQPSALYHRLTGILATCVTGTPPDRSNEKMYVMPLYDNPPVRLLTEKPQEAEFLGFTASTRVLQDVKRKGARWTSTDLSYVELAARYNARDDEFGMTCLLALHRRTPMLVVDASSMERANLMGIGAERSPVQEQTSFTVPRRVY